MPRIAMPASFARPAFLALPPLALYIHLPWCLKKCPYCDFNSHEWRGGGDGPPEDAYVDALVADLEHALPSVWGRKVSSVFLGGGTPSLFSPEAIDRLLAAVRARIPLSPIAEVTMEANPGTFERARFEGYREAGVNRLSIGVQSFTPRHLAALGRVHDAGEARAAAAAAVELFDEVNLDLMYGLPEQSVDDALADVEEALAFRTTHLSCYQLTLEPNTPFHRHPPALPDEDDVDAMANAVEARLARAGFGHYEVSAHARPGHECRHNLNYWRFGDYLGIGAGAHGKLSLGASGEVRRRWKVKNPREYLAGAGTAAAIGGDEALPPAQLPFDYMLNALRLHEGFALDAFEARTGLPRSAIAPQLDAARARGWLAIDGDRVVPTELGRRFTNDVIGLFLAD